MFTELDSRKLWFDGTNQVDPANVLDLLVQGCSIEKIVVNYSNKDVEDFNLLSDVPLEIGKSKNVAFDFNWNIPQTYKDLNLPAFILAKVENLNQEYKVRAEEELKEVEKRGLADLFKTIIYVVDTLRQNNQIWGVGRGSSCASLILFLIGIHRVDPIKYGISASEFFHN